MEPIVTDPNAPAGAPGGAEMIKDSDQNRFMADVVEASREVPVIVDFWATWCGPCKQLGPALEKAVTEAGGQVRLVKIDVDKSPELAQQLRIQSIPTVYAFRDGQPVDGFQGALPESQLKEWIGQLVQQHGGGAQPADDPVGDALTAAEEALASEDISGAGALFAQVLNHDANNTRALAGMARAYLKAGKADKARELIDSASAEARESEEVAGVVSAIEMAEAGAKAAGEIDSLHARVEANPKDHQARFDLATALYATGETEAAMDALIEIIRQDREWNDEAARKELLKIFDALGPTDPMTLAGRRKLSSVLFS